MTCPTCGRHTGAADGVCPGCQSALPAVVDPSRSGDPAAQAGSPSGQPQARRTEEQDALATLPPTRLTTPPTVPATPGPGTPASGRTTPFSWPGALANGEPFGPRYRIIKLLGAGGMGVVYQAWDAALEEPVALKIIRPEVTVDPETARELERRFKRELQLARQVSHKNVVRIHDLGEIDGISYLSMAYVQGADLHTVLRREGRLPVARALALARQVAAGLAAAHEAGVVHRDLKPANIMVDEAGHACIMDFGIARSLVAEAVTQAGVVVGTLEYMPPEQAQGHPADERSDIYAFGLILNDMLAGRRPEAARNPTAELMQRLREPPPSVRLLDPSIPEPVEHLLASCLAPRPEDRFQSSAELVRALEALDANGHLRSGATEVRPAISRWNRWHPSRWNARQRWSLAAVALVAVVALAALSAGYVARRTMLPAPGAVERGVVPPLAERRLLAVAPFRTVGDEQALGHLSLGLADALSSKLFQLKDVHVTAPLAVERAARQHADDATALARSLGVNLLVQGSVRGDANRIRVTVTLDDMYEGERIWAEDFNAVPADLIALEDRVFEALVARVGVTPSVAERGRGAVRPTLNAEAYDLYLRGRRTLRAAHTADGFQSAIRLFDEALERDPNLALARSGAADAALRMYRETRDPLWADRALHAAETAAKLDATLPEVHYALGGVYQQMGRHAEAIQELRRALEISPTSDDAHRRLGMAYLRTGKADEAIAALRKAVEINPFFWNNHNALGAAYLQIGDYAASVASNTRVVELEPENVNGWNDLGAGYLQMGRFREAADAFHKALALEPVPEAYTNLGAAHYYAGEFEESVSMFRRAVELSPNNDLFVGNLADGYRQAGDRQRAGEAYEQAIALAYKELALNPRAAQTRANVGRYYAKQGRHDEARRFLREARAMDSANVNIAYAQAQAEALAGRTADALAALGEALAAGYPVVIARADPDLAGLRDAPGFAELLRRHAGPAP
jgi:eukaryotic-like serine/threonine-protein kinase